MLDFNYLDGLLKIKTSIENKNKNKPFKKLGFQQLLEELEFPYKIFPIQQKMVDFCLTNNLETKLLLATRHIGKSDLITVMMPLYKLHCDPTYTCLIIAKNKDTAKLFMDPIVRYARKRPDLFHTTHTKITQEKVDVLDSYKTSKDKSISYVTRDTSLRARHPKEIIIDDIVEFKENQQMGTQAKAFAVYQEAQALSPNIKIIGQTNSPHDIYSTLRSTLPTNQIMEVWQDNPELPDLLKKDLKVLELNGASREFINANYLGRLDGISSSPLADIKQNSELLPLEKILQIASQCTLKVAFMDTSLGGNDYTAITLLFNKNTTWYAFGISDKIAWHLFLDKFKDFFVALQKLNINLFYEKNGVGNAPRDILYNKINLKSTPVVTTENKKIKIGKKYVKIINTIFLVTKNEKYYSFSRDYFNQIKNYAPLGNATDDAVDSLVMAYNKLTKD